MVPCNVIISTAYGQMMVNRHDINQTQMLMVTGRNMEHGSITLLADVIRAVRERSGSDVTLLDIGACFGCFALGCQDAVGDRGRIIAFEAQREIYHCLVGSVALSGKHNIYCVNRVVGAAPGVVEMPSYDYDRKLNFGSVEFGQRQMEPLEQTRRMSTELVDVVTLAALEPAFNDGPLVLKIDVEGMELEVLEGGSDLIERRKPPILVEHAKCGKTELRNKLLYWGYELTELGLNYLALQPELHAAFQRWSPR